MRTKFWTLVTGLVLAASCAQATVTLRFSQAFAGGIASGFSTQTGVAGVDGLKWGIVVDTAGNGFAGNGTTYFGMPGGPDVAAFMSVNGFDATDDYFIPATTLTADYSAQMEGGPSPVAGSTGTIGQIAGVPYGVNGIDEGDAFAIVWFSANSTASGEYYGFFRDEPPTFVIPDDGFTSDYDAAFVGVDPIRNAQHLFLTPGPQEIAVFNGASTAPGDERVDNTGTADFGIVNAGANVVKIFTIKNTGSGALTDIAVTKAAAGSPNDFTLDDTSLATTLGPGASTTFTVTFAPNFGGSKTAVIEIASNDENENPFEIQVAGSALGLALNSGMAVGPDDPATALTALQGSTVKYSVNVAAYAATSAQVVVWVPVPLSSDVNFQVGPTNINLGGVYTAGGVTVNGANVPANSVYWDLGDLAVADGSRLLQFEIALSASVPDDTTYTTSVSAQTATQSDLEDSQLVLTIGTPNLPPAEGTIQVTQQTIAAKSHVTVTFNNWTDPEGDVPLSYGVHSVGAADAEAVAVADGPNATVSFDLPPNPTYFTYVARIKDSLGHVTNVPFTVNVPEIEIQQPEDTVIADGGSVNFGIVGVGASQSLSFTIKNNGTANLTGLSISKDFTHASMFTVTASPTAPVAAGGTTTFTVRFSPTSAGEKVAKIHIASNDADESSYDITLNGSGTATIAPAVVTLAADTITFAGATLHGTVDAQGSERDVTFEYGTTTAYGLSATATPATLSSDEAEPVSAVLTGLQPHTKYNFRVKATGILGSSAGLNQFFTTGNRAPEALADNFATLPGVKMSLPVLTNDDDADDDTLTITSFTALSVPTAGTLTKTGNALFFTAAATFVGAAETTFSYTIADGFGGTSTATVTLTAASFTITPTAKTMLSKAATYEIAVNDVDDANGLWSVTESLSWVTVSPTSGVGDGTVTVTLLPNASVNDRPGTITIAGISHALTQEGVEEPALSQPDPGNLVAIVGDFYSLLIPTEGAPVTYKVIGTMPPGLKLDNATGIISGIPTKGSEIPYELTVSASNLAGPAPESVTFEILVKAIPIGAVGTFHGLVDRETDLNSDLGSRFELTTTALGTYTGKIITGTTTQAFKGKLKTYPDDEDHPSLYLEIPRKGKPTLIVDVSFDAIGNAMAGEILDENEASAAVAAWRNAWNTDNPATNYALLHTFSLEQPDPDLALPQGYGYGSFTVKGTTGGLTIVGKLADGSDFTTATHLGQDGQILVYKSLYTNRGSLAGILNLAEDNTVGVLSGDELSWFKPAPLNATTSKDTIYKDGFGPLDLIVEGATYVPPVKGTVVMQLLNAEDNAELVFTDGGLGLDEFEITFDLLNPSATGVSNKATIDVHANKVHLPTIKPATGAFGGDFTIPGVPVSLNRKVIFQGLIVQHSDGTRGYGYFLMPQLPATSAEKLTTTPKHSGRVLLNGLKFAP